MSATSYLIGIGSNRRHGRHGAPERIVAAAVATMADAGLGVIASSRVRPSRPVGPTGRRFANAAARVQSPLAPLELLACLKAIERRFGRRRGRRWGARVLDLDILAWSGGRWPRGFVARGGPLVIPHPHLSRRRFALDPAAALAPAWRIGSITLRQAAARAARSRPVDHIGARP